MEDKKCETAAHCDKVSWQCLKCAGNQTAVLCLDNEDKKRSLRSMAPILHKTGIKTHHGSSISLWSISLPGAPDLDGLILNNRAATYLYGAGHQSERKINTCPTHFQVS